MSITRFESEKLGKRPSPYYTLSSKYKPHAGWTSGFGDSRDQQNTISHLPLCEKRLPRIFKGKEHFRASHNMIIVRQSFFILVYAINTRMKKKKKQWPPVLFWECLL